MKAAVCRRPTSLGARTITDTAVPAVPEDGLLVRVRASSANPVDLYAPTLVAHLLRGREGWSGARAEALPRWRES